MPAARSCSAPPSATRSSSARACATPGRARTGTATLDVIARVRRGDPRPGGRCRRRRSRRAVAGGLGHRRVALVEPPAAERRPAARPDGRAARPARGAWTTTPTPRRWPSTPRARRKDCENAVLVALGTGIGGGAHHRWPGLPRRARVRRASSATWSSITTAPTAPATAPGAAAWRRWPRAAPSAWPASARRATLPDSPLGRQLDESGAVFGARGHRACARRRRVGPGGAGRRRAPAGGRADRHRQHPRPGRGGHRRRRRRRRRPAAGPRARGAWPRGRCRRPRARRGSCPPISARRPGVLGAGLLARELL